MFKKATLAVLVACLSTAQALIEHGFTHEQLAGIRSKLEPEARASWESGTAMQALIEIDHPEQSVFGKCPFPILPIDDRTTDLFKIAGRVVDGKPANILAFMVDGAAADPAANGVGVLVAGASHPETDKYIEAARDQLIYITEVAPKSELGLISHRSEEVQAWADYISMVPTFLAYWGAIHPGTEDEYKYLYEAYNQIRLYRDVLRDPESGLWHHVLLGGWSDAGLWATGQGWAAHGMLRVHQTIAKSSIKDSFESELQDLVNWAEEIVGATWARQHPEGYLTNYLDYGRESFPELSATALMAATTYRLAMITNATAHIENADRAFALIKTKISDDGWLVDVVDPYGFTVAADPPQSPEGNSFCLMLQAAFRDYQAFYNGINNSLGSAFSSLAKAVSLSKIVARDTK